MNVGQLVAVVVAAAAAEQGCRECGNDIGPYDGLCLDCLEGNPDCLDCPGCCECDPLPVPPLGRPASRS